MARCEECGEPIPCSGFHPAVGTVEDSHAALAKEMRRVAARKRDEGAPLDISLPENEWAARVEQLGREADARLGYATGKWETEAEESRAREAEIAKVREEMERGAFNQNTGEGAAYFVLAHTCRSGQFPCERCRLAARLGGAS